MKAVMSLWTGTPDFRLNRRNAILFSAAAAYVNRAWENTELVTDRRGLRIAERLGWQFCSVVTALDGFCPTHALHVFALGKIEAQRIQRVPHAHIDFDVLCYNLPPRRWREAQVGYQSIDEPDGYVRPERAALLRDYFLDGVTPVNTGLVCWNNLALLGEYAERAFAVAIQAAKKCGDGLSISLVAEQAVLGALLRERGVRGEALIPMASMATPDDFKDCPFTHLWAHTKQQPKWADKVAYRFNDEFPDRYAAAVDGFAALRDKGLVTS
jgi:hypothetical protein